MRPAEALGRGQLPAGASYHRVISESGSVVSADLVPGEGAERPQSGPCCVGGG